jgi:hypothetical protein
MASGNALRVRVALSNSLRRSRRREVCCWKAANEAETTTVATHIVIASGDAGLILATRLGPALGRRGPARFFQCGYERFGAFHPQVADVGRKSLPRLLQISHFQTF